jgi:flagellar basal body-associated protein FliL
MRHVPVAALLLLSSALVAVEAKPEAKPEVKPADATTPATTAPPSTAPGAPDKTAEPAAIARQPDPTAAIVAEGRYVYRQRDLDALMLIAARHAKARFSKAEEDRVRETLINALLAREPLMDALATLPSAFSGPEREALLLDLLDYQADPAKAPAAPATNDPAASASSAPVATGAPTAPGASAAPPATPASANGPLLIRLPPLTLVRTLPGTGKRQLSLTIALFFRDQAQAQKLQDRAPLVQDAILSHIQGLSAAQFVEPNQLTLKDGITAAIIAKVPDFPPDAVLIPEMESGAPDAVEPPKATAP